MRRWFSNLMIGRYGMDNLNRLLLYVAAILILIGLFVHAYWLNVITVIILIILYCRMFSRCIYKRQQENMKYLELKNKVFGNKEQRAYNKTRKADRKAAKEGKRVLICPHCKEKLRVPVGAGKIKIRCPHCKQQFEETV